jgi:hypothetical protein
MCFLVTADNDDGKRKSISTSNHSSHKSKPTRQVHKRHRIVFRPDIRGPTSLLLV